MKPLSCGIRSLIIERDDGVCLAAEVSYGAEPTVVFFNGLRSHKGGTKARAVHQWAQQRGVSALTFDYSGHGQSEGVFEFCSVSTWIDDGLKLIGHWCSGPIILVGSSMGTWIALHVALRLGPRVAGFIGLASAPDFPLELTRKRLDEKARRELLEQGVTYLPSRYDDGPYPITQQLLDDGQRLRLLHRPIAVNCAVRLVHGMADPDVPWSLSVRLAETVQSSDVYLELIKTGDHRLSKPHEIGRLFYWLDDLLAAAGHLR